MRAVAMLVAAEMLVVGLGCAHGPVATRGLAAATTIPRVQVVSGAPAAARNWSTTVAGRVLRHVVVEVGDDRAGDLSIAPVAGGPPVRIRYRLPAGLVLPVTVGTSVQLRVYRRRPQDAPRSRTGLVLHDATGRLLALVDDTGAVPTGAWGLPLRVVPTARVAYRESGRFSGLCEAIVEHRWARIGGVDGAGQQGSVLLRPGETRTVRLQGHRYVVLLAELARTVRATCEGLDLDRFAYVVVLREGDGSAARRSGSMAGTGTATGADGSGPVRRPPGRRTASRSASTASS